MKSPLVLLALLILLAPGSPAAGQQRMAPARAPASGWIGISINLEEGVDARGRAFRSVVVTDVVEGSPAARAGFRPGDRVLRLEGRPASEDNFRRYVTRLAAGDPLRMTVERGGWTRELTVVAGERPADYVVALPRSMVVRVDQTLQRLDSLRVSIVGLRSAAGGAVRLFSTDSTTVLVGRQLTSGSPLGVPGEVFFRKEARDTAGLWRVFVASEAGGASASSGRYSFEHLVREDSARARLWMARERDLEALAARRVTAERVRAATGGGDPLARALLPHIVGQNRIAGAQLTPLNAELASYFEVSGGLLVTDVIPGTPAAEAGLAPGDVVVAAADRPVRSLEALRTALLGEGAGPLPLTVVRKGRTLEMRLPR